MLLQTLQHLLWYVSLYFQDRIYLTLSVERSRFRPFRTQAQGCSLVSTSDHSCRLCSHLLHRYYRLVLINRDLRPADLEPSRPPPIIPQRRHAPKSSWCLLRGSRFCPRPTRNQHRRELCVSRYRYDCLAPTLP